LSCQSRDNEALRLGLAFYCIMEPDKRQLIVDLAESYARDSPAIEGQPNFKVLSNRRASKKKPH
jgi:hypothetical protein